MTEDLVRHDPFLHAAEATRGAKRAIGAHEANTGETLSEIAKTRVVLGAIASSMNVDQFGRVVRGRPAKPVAATEAKALRAVAGPRKARNRQLVEGGK